MSGSIEEKNNPFEDYYKNDNFDDNELQGRLYAEIYYNSNIESESGTPDALSTIQSDSIANEMNVESERLQHKSKEQSSTSETIEADSQKRLSTNQTEFVQVDTLAGRRINPVTYRCDNESPEDSSITQRKEKKNCKKFPKHANNECEKSSEKDHNDVVYSKYNVTLKCVKEQKLLAKQTEDGENSDSEESIFEVPVPPKPKPLVIDLQDSDEESNTNSGIDLILKKWKDASIKTYSRVIPSKRHESETSSNHQNIPSRSKHTDRASNNIVNPDNNIRTRVQEAPEDIVLNCTVIQRGAKSVSEIKQLSKSAGANKSIEDSNQKKKSLQYKSNGNSENNANLEQEMSVTSERNLQMRMQQNVDKSNVTYMDQDKMSGMESCTPMNPKRQCNNEVDRYPKRQCTIQQNVQNIMPRGNNNGEKQNISGNEYFKPMPEEMRNYYNLSRGQDNFDIEEVQRGMSKDPRMWTILDEDIMPCPSSRQRIRFWNVRRFNWQDDNQRYDYSSPRKMPCCYMCGMKNHMEFQCPQKMCLTCGKRQNTFRNTCEYCRVLYCTMCNSVGHELEQCPDLWRRYHQTTDMSSTPQDPGTNIMKPLELLYCCNCAKRGHESSMCKEYRWSRYFPTPAVVTNYTDGPTYTSCTPNSSEPDPKTGFLVSEATANRTSIPQNANKQHAIIKNVKPSANKTVDTLLPSTNFYVSPASQETVSISEIEGNLKSHMTNKIWLTEKSNLRQTPINHFIKFTSVIHSYGHFRNKRHKDARMILENLTVLFKTRQSMLNSLMSKKITPVFLEMLLAKSINFEVKIGFTQHQILSLQLLAMKEFIEYLYDLLRYWLDLPDDEKNYGIDITLPISSIKMFNYLDSRLLQLKKMCVIHTKETNKNLLQIYKDINDDKTLIKRYENQQGFVHMYRRTQKRLCRKQSKLLLIANTKPKPNIYVHTFQEMMQRLKSEQHLMGETVDTATYLRLVLLYNRLFVPHTSYSVHMMLQRIEEEEKRNKSNSQVQQKPEITAHEQGNVAYNVHSSSMSSCIPQNLENSFAIDQQNNKMLIEEQNVNNISLEMNKTTNYDCDEIIIIKDSTQDSQIMPLNIESAYLELDSKRNEGQLSTGKINIKSNVSTNKQNINVNNTVSNLTKNERKKELRDLKKINTRTGNVCNLELSSKLCESALNLIRKARTFKLKHFEDEADHLERLLNNRRITRKKLKKLSYMIHIEEKYQKINKIHKKISQKKKKKLKK